MHKTIKGHYIYLITNNLNGHNYIGQKTIYSGQDPEHDGYWGSGLLINKAIRKHGLQNFSKQILAYCYTKQESDILERQYIKMYKEIGKAEYNISEGGNGGYLGDDIVKKISETCKKNYQGEDGERRKRLLREKRKHQNPLGTQQAKDKRAVKIRQFWDSPQGQLQRQLNSQKHKGTNPAKGKHWFHNDTVQILAEVCPEGFVAGQLSGKHHSEQYKQNHREFWKNLPDDQKAARIKKAADARRGKHHSDSCKANISKANTGRRYFNNGEIEVKQFQCPPGFVPGRCPKAKAAIVAGSKK